MMKTKHMSIIRAGRGEAALYPNRSNASAKLAIANGA